MMSDTGVPSKAVVVCADDFAVHGEASLGIAELARNGRISATSVMVLSPRWPQDVGLLKELPQAIDVGLHLDWTSTFAVASGHGMSLPAAMGKALLGGFGRGAAGAVTRAVIERQLDAFEARWKAPPDFVDGHQHVQQFAGIREALVQALVKRYGACHQPTLSSSRGQHTPVIASAAWRSINPEGMDCHAALAVTDTTVRIGRLPYLRISRAPAGYADLKSRVIAAMGADALEKLARGAGLRCSGALLGTYNFSGDQAGYACQMASWLRAAPTLAIIMCHPAMTHWAGDAHGTTRAQEFAYLSSPEFAAALARAAVTLARGSTGLTVKIDQ